MKMIDIGFTYPALSVVGSINKSPKQPDKQYPSFTVRDKKEMFENCEVGEEYTITAKVKCTRKESNESENSPGGGLGGQSFDLQILQMKINGMRMGSSHEDYAEAGAEERAEKAKELIGEDED